MAAVIELAAAQHGRGRRMEIQPGNIVQGEKVLIAADNVLRAWARVMLRRVGPAGYSNQTIEASMKGGRLGKQSAKREPYNAVEEIIEGILVNRTPVSWRVALCVEYLGYGSSRQKARDLNLERHRYLEEVQAGQIWIFAQTVGRQEFANHYAHLA